MFKMSNNEVAIDYDLSKTLRQFCYTPKRRNVDERPILQHVYMNAKEFCATDSKSLVIIPTDGVMSGKIAEDECGEWMVHSDVMLLVRSNKEHLVVNLETGAMRVEGYGPAYPLSIPDASQGSGYPNYRQVLDTHMEGDAAANFGVSPELLDRVRSLHDKEVHFAIPPNNEAEGCVTKGLRFHVPDTGAHGVIMPRRITEE